MQWDNPAEFASWFVTAFITPMFEMLMSYKLLGVTLYGWFFGFLGLQLAVIFYNAYQGSTPNGKG